MHRVHADLSLDRRQRDHVDVLGVDDGVRRHDFELQCVRPCSALPDFLDSALHVEVVLRDVIVFAVEDLLESAHRVAHFNLPPSRPVNTCAELNGWLRKR